MERSLTRILIGTLVVVLPLLFLVMLLTERTLIADFETDAAQRKRETLEFVLADQLARLDATAAGVEAILRTAEEGSVRPPGGRALQDMGIDMTLVMAGAGEELFEWIDADVDDRAGRTVGQIGGELRGLLDMVSIDWGVERPGRRPLDASVRGVAEVGGLLFLVVARHWEPNETRMVVLRRLDLAELGVLTETRLRRVGPAEISSLRNDDGGPSDEVTTLFSTRDLATTGFQLIEVRFDGSLGKVFRQSTTQFAVALVLAILGLYVATGAIIRYRILRPIVELRREVDRAIAAPNFERTIIGRYPGELGDLANGFKEMIARLRGVALRDALTGLPTRILLREKINDLIYRSFRRGGGFSLLYLDLNGFKPINDRLGHEAGDRVLKEIAHRLQSRLRRSDMVARVGGDEFVMVLDETDLELPDRIAESLSEVFSTPIALPAGDQQVRIWASVGEAHYPRDGQDGDALLRSADTDMYAVKQGRKPNPIGVPGLPKSA